MQTNELVENNLLFMINQELYTGLNAPNWLIYQLSKQGKLEKKLEKSLYDLNKLQIEEAIKEAKKSGITDKHYLETLEESIKAPNKTLVQSAMKTFRQSCYKVIELRDYKQKTDPNLQQTLQQSLDNVINNNINIGMTKINFNGRKYGYKEYMENRIRTSISNEIVTQQLDHAQKLSQVFYITNYFNNAASDHYEYQGKIYYNKDFMSFDLPNETKEEIQRFIDEKGLISYQDISDGTYKGKNGKGVYLCTRPNCRHRMQPISIRQALNKSVKELREDLHMDLGSNRTQRAYEDSQKQRYCERMIRNEKFKKMQFEQILQNDPTNEYAKKSLQNAKRKITGYGKQINMLVNRNKGYLSRDRARETRLVVRNDLHLV